MSRPTRAGHGRGGTAGRTGFFFAPRENSFRGRSRICYPRAGCGPGLPLPSCPDLTSPPIPGRPWPRAREFVTLSLTESTDPAVAAPEEPLRTSMRGRLGSPLVNHVKALLGPPSQRRLARAALYIDRIRHHEAEFERLSDAELKVRGLQLRGRARGGESLDKLLPEAFGLVCVGAVRVLKLRPF